MSPWIRWTTPGLKFCTTFRCAEAVELNTPPTHKLHIYFLSFNTQRFVYQELQGFVCQRKGCARNH